MCVFTSSGFQHPHYNIIQHYIIRYYYEQNKMKTCSRNRINAIDQLQ